MKYKIVKKNRLFEDNAEEQKSPVETPEQTAAKERLEKVNQILEKLKNVYWSIAVDIPEEIIKVFPDFKQNNPDAAPSIKAWADFKQNPSEQTFNKFIDEFTKYGTESSKTKAEVAESAVFVQQTVESVSTSFGQKLNNKLAEKTKQSFYNHALEKGYFEPQMKF